MTVKDIDRGYKNLMKVAKQIKKGASVKVGILGGESEAGEGASVVEYATYNEFGTDTIPERSFIRATVDERRNRIYGQAFKLQGELFSARMSMSQALDILGLLVQGQIQNKIEKLRTPPNDPKTIAQKQSSNPLIDTGRMRQSVSYEKEL